MTLPDLPAPLQAALDRLASHPRVAGALLIGSLPAGTLTPTSDYDLVVIIDDLAPLWYVGVTTIGGKIHRPRSTS
jgi:predicted nucleotidyltransferase